MAFTIKIYEKNGYIYTLLQKRLSSFFPDAYIVDPYLEPDDLDDRFSSYTKVIYDPADMNEEQAFSHTTSPIRLTEDGGAIDCARLIHLLRTPMETPTIPGTVKGTLSAVIPFVYTDVRDRFICELSDSFRGADINIRLDFTSKLRALWKGSSGCNMTSLLEACRSKRFTPEDILKYCNMDDLGFLTPGSCTNYDDVYDLGAGRSVTLMNLAAELVHSKTRSVNVLAVIEGFRTKDLPELLCGCDMVYILLPSKTASEDPGAQDLISMLKKILGPERITVYYAAGPNETSDEENIGQREIAV